MRKKITLLLVVLAALLIFIWGIHQWLYLREAHRTFENYYAFRGCAQLLEKTADYGTCKTTSGKTIKIVKFQNKWYLDGDLPWACFGGMCVGL